MISRKRAASASYLPNYPRISSARRKVRIVSSYVIRRTPACVSSKVIPDPPVYSVRVGIGYRALGVKDGDTITWFWIGSHADYDQILKSL